MQIYRVTLTRTQEQDVYILAESRAAAADAALDEIDVDWHWPDADVEVSLIDDVANAEEVEPSVHLYGADMALGEWLAQQAEAERQRLEREATPGTAEYQAACEAEGQLRLDQIGGAA